MVEEQLLFAKKNDTYFCEFIDYLLQYIEIEIKCNYFSRSIRTGVSKAKTSRQTISARWTGSKRSLIELAYAINQTDCINDGKITFKDLIRLLSEVFHIELSDFYSVLNRIRDRKPCLPIGNSRAFFLNELASVFEKKLEALDD